MKKTLVINYTPRQGSNTKKMVDHFIDRNKEKTEITIVDLTESTPDLLLKDNLNPMVARNFAGIAPSEDQQKLLDKNDQFADQIMDTDYIVLVTPVYNYSLPATVKAWFDAIIQPGKTLAMTEKGLVGLSENTKAVLLTTSGGDLASDSMKHLELATPLVKACFDLLGITTEEAISVFGTQQYADTLDELLEASKEEINTLSDKWY